MVDNVSVTASPHSGADAEVAILKRDVAGLKDDFVGLSNTVTAGFEKLTAKLETKTSPNWHVVGIVVPVLVAGVAAVWILFSTYSGHIEAVLKELKDQQSQFKPISQINTENGYLGVIADLRSQLASKDSLPIAADVSRLGKEVDELKSSKADAAETARLGKEIDALKSSVSDKMVSIDAHKELWARQNQTNEDLSRFSEENRRALFDLQAKIYEGRSK